MQLLITNFKLFLQLMKIERIVRLIIGTIFYVLLALTLIIISPVIFPLITSKAIKFLEPIFISLKQKSLNRKGMDLDFELNPKSKGIFH